MGALQLDSCDRWAIERELESRLRADSIRVILSPSELLGVHASMKLSKVTIDDHVDENGTVYQVVTGTAQVEATPYFPHQTRVYLTYMSSETEGATVSAEVEDPEVYSVAVHAYDLGKVIRVTIEEWPDGSIYLTDASTQM